MERLKKMYGFLTKRWAVSSFWQFLLIMTVFSVTGFSILYVRSWIFDLLGITKAVSIYWRILLSVVVIMPVYQVLLLFYGFIFGQFRFFWNFEKRFFSRITTIFHYAKKRGRDDAPSVKQHT
jgi:hypothetical protein